MTTAAEHATPRSIEVEELFADPASSGASISPDGSRIAYLAPAHGRRNVWVRGVEEDHASAVCVTHDSRRGITNYYWTDDPRWLLYLQDTDGNEDWHLFRVDLAAPEEPAVDLTPLPPGGRVLSTEPVASRPGDVLVVMNERPAAFDYFMIEVATGATTVHLRQDDPTRNLLLDRDGQPAFDSRQTEDGSYEFFAIDAATGERRLVRRMVGVEYPVGVNPQLVTPDGKGLLVGVYQDSDDLRLVRIDRETGEESVVAAVEGHDLEIRGAAAPGVLPPVLLLDRRTGAVLAARFAGERPRVEAVDEHFAEVQAALSGLSDGVLETATSDDSGRRWVATFTSDREPGVTWFHDRATGESRELFRAHPLLDPAELAPVVPVTFPARDGLPLPAFLTLPVGVEPVRLPLVLLVHGGPWFSDAWEFSPAAQLLANRGYAVLQVNYRGSVGQGRRHLTAAVGEIGRGTQTDLLDAADWAVEQGYADPDRIAIMGGSYGGYAALVGVTTTPDRFAAAVDYVGISDLTNFLATLPPFLRPLLVNNWYAYLGDPEDPAAREDMLQRSPITLVDRIRTPLLVAAGANDVRVVQAESDNIVASLRERGVPVEYLLAADEGHGFENPENQIRLHRTVVEHFATHLGGRRPTDREQPGGA
ncbi:S9 family peptidase [Auraticoccus monumenti]|uniref:Dipeptidyl aminopeptidase/acylaminoacyl peptidase n=1 Tax=Auraticoccus monumenti TaxID=675864 RepID=A0A1G6ZS63_9ACTN|nr:S9 family peptidase [Auraticoccus monumenti]SDE05528.1 Dipeptidyl aminopeptidase/acylaminoacyl peptidase [Auraticoccus monumenti]